ncbi:MAG TPA: cache domain-containing protein, partial [Armatimonadota bacterium]|nr:cache domain-containing protein [Armatimonadota bacterium]
MNATTRVDFHCHSTYSDGALSPPQIAAELAADGVAFASLTDHDSVAGLLSFRHMLSRRGVGYISGVEMTAECNGREAHLLGYGFEPSHPELQATLLSVRRAQTSTVHSVADSIRGRASYAPADPSATPVPSAAPSGRIDIADAIALIHRAGGKAFLAHPLVLEPDLEALRALLTDLKARGLDGIEAIYGPSSDEERERLCAMADELGLLVSAGSDAHDRRGADSHRLGVDIPTELWKQFRDAVCCGPADGQAGIAAAAAAHPRHRMKKRHFFFHVVFPTLLAMALFAVAIFAVFLPAFERSLMERKRETIRELTEAAWSILAGYEREERAGILSRAQAQELAVSRIQQLRYGPEGKDYFWLQDMQPRMIMHPYRKDLDGKDLSQFRDSRGDRIFVEFADLVRREGEGYIDYVWQWKDDPSRLAPKESYIKGFKPWGWIIGTGIYTEDVKQEIGRIERRLVRTLAGISVIVALLLLYVMQ